MKQQALEKILQKIIDAYYEEELVSDPYINSVFNLYINQANIVLNGKRPEAVIKEVMNAK